MTYIHPTRFGGNNRVDCSRTLRWLCLAIGVLISSLTISQAAQLTLRWQDNSADETGFEIERGTTATGPFSRLTTVSQNTSSYVDTSVTASTRYFYRVRAVNSTGASAYTNVADAVPTGTISEPTPPPSEPTPITKTAQTITFAPLAARTYGNSSFALSATASSGLPVSYTSSNTSVATISGNTVTLVGAGTTTITAAQAGDATYAPAANVQQPLSVNKATLNVAAANKSRTYGAANPSLTATLTGFANGDTVATSVTGSAALSTTATTSSAVGSYPITISIGTLAAQNYTFSGFALGTLTVVKAPLTVSADAKTKAVGQENPPLTASITGFVNGQTLISSGVTGSPALTTTATTSSPAGTYPIRVAVGSLSSANYSFSQFVDSTLTVTNKGRGKKSRLANLSVRSDAGTGSETLTVGFAVEGTQPKSLLVRGIGPSLTEFGVNEPLSDPSLSVYSGSTALTSNDDWASNNQMDTIADATTAVNAFPITADSKDAAVLTSVDNSIYTAQVVGKTTEGGVALAEIYDADDDTVDSRLINVSARAHVATGENVLIAGFTVKGEEPITVLIRAVGPTLSKFGVTGTLANPQLAIMRQGETAPVGQNDDWNGSAELKDAFTAVGAFSLEQGSKDAAVVVTLEPGTYSAVVSGVNDTTGVAIVELYEMP